MLHPFGNTDITMSIKLIVGLANPGPEYSQTRHNAGQWFIEALASDPLKTESKFHSSHALITLHGAPVRLMIPTTYMNESGKAVAAYAQFFKINPDEILVVHDELDLEPGVARLKQGGGHGGHNGLRHIIQCLGTPNFHRLRIGIGHPGNKDQVVDFVLHKPSSEDRKAIDDAIYEALRVMPLILSDKMQDAMKELHT
jgi:PTH1 family peptidyl-tRNA hydrolase